MGEGAHDLYLPDQALLSLVLGERRLFGKGLDCIAAAFLCLVGQVDRGEVALPDLFLGLVLLVEAALVDPPAKHRAAGLEVGFAFQKVGAALLALLEVERGWGELEPILDLEIQGNVEGPLRATLQ